MRYKIILPLLIVFFTVCFPHKVQAISIIILSVDKGNSNVELTFDLGNSPDFPPPQLPACYYPSQGTQTNSKGIYIEVRVINIFGQSISNAYLDIKAYPNPSASVTCDQIYWTITPTTLPSPGTEPQPPWTPLSLNWDNVDIIPIGRRSIYREYYMDMCFKLESDDEPTPPSGIETTIYIRFYGL